jgi:DNA-binding LytR/AlgR family response regulator
MSRRIRTLVVEDEPLAREGLLMYIREAEFLEIAAVCEDALQANKALGDYDIDLMFLDIQMPKITGIDFLKSVKNPPLVIVTTAYPHFALQGFELDVVDYLVKPYPFDRFLKAANKANELFALRNKVPEQNQPEEYFFVKCEHRFEKIYFKEILFMEGMENYVVIHTTRQKYMTLVRMKSMEEMLKPADFIRIHRSYIASVRAITAIDGNDVIVDGKRLPVSRERRSEIMQRLLRDQAEK